jgi:hypothetical protein
VARHADHSPEDPTLVLVDDDEPVAPLDDWLALVASDGPTDRDIGAAAVVREFREHEES